MKFGGLYSFSNKQILKVILLNNKILIKLSKIVIISNFHNFWPVFYSVFIISCSFEVLVFTSFNNIQYLSHFKFANCIKLSNKANRLFPKNQKYL